MMDFLFLYKKNLSFPLLAVKPPANIDISSL